MTEQENQPQRGVKKDMTIARTEGSTHGNDQGRVWAMTIGPACPGGNYRLQRTMNGPWGLAGLHGPRSQLACMKGRSSQEGAADHRSANGIRTKALLQLALGFGDSGFLKLIFSGTLTHL